MRYKSSLMSPFPPRSARICPVPFGRAGRAYVSRSSMDQGCSHPAGRGACTDEDPGRRTIVQHLAGPVVELVFHLPGLCIARRYRGLLPDPALLLHLRPCDNVDPTRNMTMAGMMPRASPASCPDDAGSGTGHFPHHGRSMPGQPSPHRWIDTGPQSGPDSIPLSDGLPPTPSAWPSSCVAPQTPPACADSPCPGPARAGSPAVRNCAASRTRPCPDPDPAPTQSSASANPFFNSIGIWHRSPWIR